MLKFLLAAGVLITAPAAFAQNDGSHAGNASPQPGVSMNMANPQAQANMAGQPGNARTVPSSGDADRIPTPVTPGQSQVIPQPDKPPSAHPIR